MPDAVESKKAYGLQGKDVVICLGWWEEYKRFEDVVEIWPQVVRNVPDAALVIAGDARPGSRGGALQTCVVEGWMTALRRIASSSSKVLSIQRST